MFMERLKKEPGKGLKKGKIMPEAKAKIE